MNLKCSVSANVVVFCANAAVFSANAAVFSADVGGVNQCCCVVSSRLFLKFSIFINVSFLLFILGYSTAAACGAR